MIRPLIATAGALVASLLVVAPAFAQGTGSATIDTILKRGQLICGVAGDSPGFSLPDSKGVMRGLDADSCRAVAAAILGDATKLRFANTTAQNRFTALQSGEIDLLYRSTTWTLGREANLGALFASVNFYDGTGFLVKAAAGVKSAKELDGATVCVAPGTSTELAVSDYFRVNNMKFTPILIADVSDIEKAFGRADATRIRPMRPGSRHIVSNKATRRRTSCCYLRSSAKSRSAAWSARATTSSSTRFAGPILPA